MSMVIRKILLPAALTVLLAFPGYGPGTETEAAVLPAPAGIAAELMKTDEERETEPAEEEPKENLKGYVESDREKEIYSYLQVPEVYSNDPDWSGGWTYIEAGGQMFFYFGCGVCCLSNMCSTLTGEAVPPDIMFDRVREETDYYPESGIGALSWSQLKTVTKGFAAEVSVKKKPGKYSRFQEDIREADTTVVLVCKDDDDKLWHYTNGHYVNIWEYDPDTDTVFVTDSSGMFNRMRVDLIDVYNALKTASSAQYMTVRGSDPGN